MLLSQLFGKPLQRAPSQHRCCHPAQAGVHATYREYDFGHMDFTFAVGDAQPRHACFGNMREGLAKCWFAGSYAEQHIKAHQRMLLPLSVIGEGCTQVKDEMRHYVLSRLQRPIF